MYFYWQQGGAGVQAGPSTGGSGKTPAGSIRRNAYHDDGERRNPRAWLDHRNVQWVMGRAFTIYLSSRKATQELHRTPSQDHALTPG